VRATPTHVRPATPADRDVWARMRASLWPEDSASAHLAEIDVYLSGRSVHGEGIALVAEDEGGELVGFAEFAVRPFAPGCEGRSVAYLEGWYVAARARGRGVGRALVEAGEAWGRERGCAEMASDAEVDNDVSAAAHGAIGFEDVGLVRCFRKRI